MSGDAGSCPNIKSSFPNETTNRNVNVTKLKITSINSI